MIKGPQCKVVLNRKLKTKFLVSDVVEDRMRLEFDVWGKGREERIEGLAFPGVGYSHKQFQVKMANSETKNMFSRSNVVFWQKEGHDQYSRGLNSLSHFREDKHYLKRRSRP
jgi:hypothetical protein